MPFREVKNPIDFPKLEKEILDFWEKNKIFEKSILTRPEDRPFTFYEGPPTANGKPGIHHVISRSMKDFVCRYQTMLGCRVNRKAGWDTHGLPVEIEVEKELGFKSKDEIEAYGVAKFNRKCRESVFRYLKEWNELTRRIGYWVDLENPYITYTNEYIETVWWLLAQMWKKGLLYQGFKILPYCSRCETALSSHETSLGYEEVTEKSITAKFPLIDGENRYILAWTTTPWTLPGNVALAVGPDILYAEVEQEIEGRKETYYLAENKLEVLKGKHHLIRTFLGKEMEGWGYRPLFDFVNLADEEHPAYYAALAEFVTTDEGTGVVHTAVMYGEDDYRLGMQIGLPAKHTVDEKGRFNERVPLWKGRYVKEPELEAELVQYLREKGRLYSEELYTHSYPHCWRCDSPLLYYAKKSWYLKTTQVKDALVENNRKIRWYPSEVGEGRFGQWLENNVDWALSRDRYWGTPLNIWVCEKCHKQTVVESVESLKKLSGLDRFEDLHKPYIDEIRFTCPECDGEMARTSEVIDCWFDSGAMPYGQFHYPFENDVLFKNNFPADFISEGVDQTRGWFYSLLAISTIISGRSSYKSCVSVEMILDKEGQKMSKSRGNVIDPFHILDNEGADALRWYLFTVSPPWVPTKFDREGVREVMRKFFGTLTNTYSFFILYANIDEFSYDRNPIPVKERPEIDRWLISTLNSLVQKMKVYLSRYDVTKAARTIQDFVIDDLSNWYVRRNRRRFWKAEMGEEKLAAYQTLFEVLMAVAKLVAPFVPFLAEDIYRNLNADGYEEWESVHLAFYPDPEDGRFRFSDKDLEDRMRLAREVVSLCRSARNKAGIRVRQPLERTIVVVSSERIKEAIRALEGIIKEEVNVRRLEFTDNVSELSERRAKPVFKELGPKFGPQVNQAAEIIRGFSTDEIRRLEQGEKIRISLGKGKHFDVESKDVEIFEEPMQSLVVESNGELTVALDIKLSEELITDGLAREFVNRIQHMRKEAEFQVTDRICVYFEASPNLHRAVLNKADYVQEEVLAVSLIDHFEEGEYNREWQMDGERVRLGIGRIQR
ncbi:MAG: isoleucine--tRNA ligase [bacterium]